MIVVIGLGVGTVDDLGKGAKDLLEKASCIITTSSWHPALKEIPQDKVKSWDNFTIRQRIEKLNELEKTEGLVLAVAGDPKTDEIYLKDVDRKLSFISAPSLLAQLDLKPPWQYLAMRDLPAKQDGTLVMRIFTGDWQNIKLFLPKQNEIRYLDRLRFKTGTSLEINPKDGYVVFDQSVTNELRGLKNLLYVMERLKGPDGCPWDKAQTFESLKPYLVEEAYELWDAVDSGDPFLISEELGDVLLQVVFYCTIAKEKGLFNFDDVSSRISEKLIRRHPHVFADEEAKTPEKVMENWELLKKDEKGKEDRISILDGVPKHLPGLEKALKVQRKAAKVGFDWDDSAPVWDKIKEELTELAEADCKKDREEELGDLLFAIVNLARFLDIGPEVALTKTINKFQKRFRYIEKHSPRPLEEMTLEEMDVFWEEAKSRDK